MTSKSRFLPNILVIGTPGVGKSTLCMKLAEITGFRWIDISQFAIKYNCTEEYDEVYRCPILNEDKLLDSMKDQMIPGGNIVEYHSCDIFPEHWFDIVFVIRTDNTILYDRLVARGYSGKKLEDNIACEIFQTILEEAHECFAKEIIHEIHITTRRQFEENVIGMCSRIQSLEETRKIRKKLIH